MFRVETQLQSVRLGALLHYLPVVLDRGVDAWAESIAADARSRGHEITGAMVTSTGVISPLRDDYTPRQSAAGELNPAAELLEAPTREPGHTAVVAVGTEYGIYEELGTVHQPAHPWFRPAVEAGAKTAEQHVGKAVRQAMER